MNMVRYSDFLSLLLLTVFYGFQCTKLSRPNKPFSLPSLGPLESGMGKMGSGRE